jgi:SAM-dependent methyltransferase
LRPYPRTSSHHQPEAQHPISSTIHKLAGRLPHLWVHSRRLGLVPERIIEIEDVDRDLPLKTEQLDLALAVHCSIHNNLEAIKTALRPGGFLIYETFGGQGMNWQDLPKAGQVQTKLKREFELLTLQERRVGPEEKRSVVVRLLARKR